VSLLVLGQPLSEVFAGVLIEGYIFHENITEYLLNDVGSQRQGWNFDESLFLDEGDDGVGDVPRDESDSLTQPQ